MRWLQIYDSTHFTLQGVVGPIAIQRLRFRAEAVAATTTWVGGSWPSVSIDMSTSAVDFLGASSNYASNHGTNRGNVLHGPVSVSAGAGNGAGVPGPYYVDIPLTNAIVYDPTGGSDLALDVMLDGTGWTGTSRPTDAISGVTALPLPPLGSRVFNTTGGPAPDTGSLGLHHMLMTEFTYAPAVGLFPLFSATPRAGATPLPVQFTDASFSSDPNGIVAWAWDVDGDTIIDYTTQNPLHTYNSCGTYTVSLTVTDASGSQTATRTNFIVTDIVTPSFTTASLGSGAFQFTDTSVPTPTSWAWDFNGDSITDSTAQNPVWAYAGGCVSARVTMTVNRLCRGPYTATQTIILTPANIAYMTGSTSTSSTTWLGGFFDLSVTNPQGASICGVTVRSTTTVPFDLAVYVTPDTYLNKDLTAAEWRLVATGTGPAATNPAAVAVNSFYLPAGNYGMAVYLQQPGLSTSMTYNSVPAAGHPGPIVTADMIMHPAPLTAPGRIRTGLFAGGLLNPRIPNVTLHYSTFGLGGDAGYGFFHTGCPSSMGISNLTHSARPTLGSTLTVDVNNLPVSLAVMMTGFSNTTSTFGPLPLDLTSYGAPGCFGRVSPDAVVFLFGAGNAASWVFGIPNDPSLGGLQLYNQALVLDPGFNGLGGVVSDATGMVIGM